MLRTTNAAQGAALRRPLTVLVVAAGLTLAGCANPATNAPGASSPEPSPPASNSAAPVKPQVTTLTWARSMCQALQPTFGRLGSPPQPDFNNPDATRQAYISYLGDARTAAQQAIDGLALIGAPPVSNGQQILGQLSNQLSQLRDNLNDALTQLKQTNPNATGAMARAFGAAGNVVGLLGTLAADSQLRTAIDQTPECQNLAGVKAPQ